MSKQEKRSKKQKKLTKLLNAQSILISTAIRLMMQGTEEATTELAINYRDQEYLIPMKRPHDMLIVTREITKEGKIKISAKLQDTLKKRIRAVLKQSKEMLLTAHDGTSDFAAIELGQWKKLIKAAELEMRVLFVETLFAERMADTTSIKYDINLK
ncbi:hypothetical protein fHeYen902_206 [Yersinia phage fHe-Yen9-02]|nr:hypothetical protein fHeYen902_206 [Yersinia phage fHe-Yen9-02]